jgi:hypothetical protein
MFLVDDLLLSPFTSLLWVFREIHNRAQQERAGEAETVTRSLSELYMRLETEAITEEEFAAEEKQLLDRLDAIERRNQGGDAESDDGADDESDHESDEGEDDADDDEDASRDAP